MDKKILITTLIIGFVIGAVAGLQLIRNTRVVEADNARANGAGVLDNKDAKVQITHSYIDNNSAQNVRDVNWSERLADRIIIGLVSEDQFRKMNLTLDQVVEVFKQIGTKRGWNFSDTDLKRILAVALKSKPNSSSDVFQPLYSGACSQLVEQANGSNYSAYPTGRTTPIGNECGGDPDDIILLYNTPNAPNTNADNVRWYSVLWWVRWVISGCYSSGLSANSLCTTQTRVCMGSCGQTLGSDLNYLYLWQQ